MSMRCVGSDQMGAVSVCCFGFYVVFNSFPVISRWCVVGAITFALLFQKFRLRLSYTCAHKSGAFALSFGVTFARVFSQFFLGQLLVFYKVLALLPLFTDLVIS